MEQICKCKNVEVIQGDIYECYFDLPKIPPEVVSKVYFTCAKAKLCVVCPYSELHDGYCLRLPSECTSHLRPVVTTYDLTVEFPDGNRLTGVYLGLFVVLEKKNPIVEEVDDGD